MVVVGHASSVAAVGTLVAWKSTARGRGPVRRTRPADEGLGRGARRGRARSGRRAMRDGATASDAIDELEADGHRPRSGRRPATTATATRSTPTTTPHPHRPERGRRAAGRSGSSAPARSGPRSASRCTGPAGRSTRSRAAIPARRERFRSLVDGSRAFAEATAARRRGRADHPRRPGRRDRAGRRRALRMYSGQAMVHTSGAARRRGPRARRWRPGPRSGRSIRSSRSPTLERAVAALHGATVAIEGDDQLADLLARMAEAIGGACRSGSRPARSRPITRPPSWPPAASSPSSTRSPSWAGSPASTRRAALAIYGPLIEQTLGNARALGIRRRPDRTDHPRRPGHARRPPRGRCAPTRPASSPSTSPPAEREIALAEGRGALTPEAAGRPARRHLQRRSDAVPLRPMERSIAAKYAARPAARFVRPSARARERRLGLRAAGSFQAASTRPTVLRRPGGSVLARLRGGWRAFRAARPAARPTAGRGPSSRCTGPRSGRAGADRRSSAATAPWRG